MSRKIGDCFDAEPLGGRATHNDGIGVVEAQGVCHANTVIGQLSPHFCLGEGFDGAQDLFADGARVVRIGVDAAGTQSLPEDDRASHSRTVNRLDSGFFEGS